MDDLNRENLLKALDDMCEAHGSNRIKQATEQMRKLISMSGVLQIKTLNQILMAINNLPKNFQEEFYKICASKIKTDG